jgi:hypothetical protein
VVPDPVPFIPRCNTGAEQDAVTTVVQKSHLRCAFYNRDRVLACPDRCGATVLVPQDKGNTQANDLKPHFAVGTVRK